MTGNNPSFHPWEREILRQAQADIPETMRPFAAMAEDVGVDEEDVIALLRRLADQGIIRRFGVTLRHQKAGYDQNAMVAWRVPEKQVQEFGAYLASLPEVSHCYLRRQTDHWPYNIYSMIHSSDPEGCLKMARKISEHTGIEDFEILASLEELKKTSMQYF